MREIMRFVNVIMKILNHNSQFGSLDAVSLTPPNKRRENGARVGIVRACAKPWLLSNLNSVYFN
jgi:hypothetical protein